jgi:hypothetical protein
MSCLILPLRALHLPGMLAGQTACISSGLAVLWMSEGWDAFLGGAPDRVRCGMHSGRYNR